MNSETKFDIIKLIEKNSITRLSKEYENKLVNKIKTSFSNSEQQIFLASFYCYLKYDSTNDFVIDFDNVWKWVGFTRKDNAKTLLEKYFTKNIDYKIYLNGNVSENDINLTGKTAPQVGGTGFTEHVSKNDTTLTGKPAPGNAGAGFLENVTNINSNVNNTDIILDELASSEEYKKLNKLNKKLLVDICKDKEIKSSGSKDEIIKRIIMYNKSNEKITKYLGGAGLNKEKIMLTVNTFKKFCLKANTQKADEIHDYYIKLENVLQETINEQTNELRLQLTNKEEENKKLEEENKKLVKKYVKKQKEIFDKKNVVYLITTEEAEKNNEFAIGKSIDLTKRREEYNNNKIHDFKVIYYVCCKGSKIMDCLESLILAKLCKYRCKAGRDVFCIPDGKDVSLFTNIFDTCLKIYDDIDDDDIRYPTSTKQDRKEYKKKYYEDNVEKFKEIRKKFYENNKCIISLLKKIYCKENEDKIKERNKKYYENHKDEIIKVNMDYYYTNKDDILEKRKEFYKNNKEFILEEREKYYKENYKTKIAPQRQQLVVCECGITITNYNINKHKKSKMHIERMENINNPITSPLKERVQCECGMVVANSSLKRHIGTKRHDTLMERLNK